MTRHRDGVVLQAAAYDNNGGLTRRDTATATHVFAYDTGGQLLSDTRSDDASPDEHLAYGYDLAGNLTAATDPGGQTVYGYDAANRLTSLADPFGQTTTFGYDNAGRQTSLTVKNSAGTQLLQTSYSYTRTGGADSDQMQSKTDATGTTAYTYDSLQRLKTAGSTNYSYDNAGNITKLGAANLTYNAADQLVNDGRARSYDTAGNLTGSSNPTETNNYSDTGQFVSGSAAAGNSFAASYDTLDQTQPRQLAYTTSGGTTTDRFTTTALGLTQAVHNGARTSLARDPRGAIVTEKTGAGARYNVVTDYQGSVVALISTTGTVAATYRYDPYGGNTATGPNAADNPIHYVGQYQYGVDMLLGYRWYFPGWGRFLTPDPTGQETNHYAYAQDDPINNSDPTGAKSANNGCADAIFGVAIIGVGLIGGAVGLAAAFIAEDMLGVGLSIARLAGAGASGLAVDNSPCR
ncbi:RHS repeat-associated core domain-containing protein [Amycolatopsis halotolerans]|uniref:RHS repeat-associated core domain-containing protein n=1 Tax=Amycolatopsis halotolerans TaxID=330083 RepID=UPI0035ED7693